MTVVTQPSAGTVHLLALMKQGDDAFNARDFAGMDAVHHPDMIAHTTGNAAPVYGRAVHAEMVRGMFRAFPDVHADNDPYPPFSSASATESPSSPARQGPSPGR